MKDKRHITTNNKSVIYKLKNQNILNEQVLPYINNLSMEELIAVKLELAATTINNRLYGFDLWQNMGNITKEALLKFAISTTKSKKDAARFLGITYNEFKRVLKIYKVNNYFTEDI
jgi:hypothetical protein